VYRLLEGHLRPGDQASLYFLLGCLSDLMAVPASGLGYPQAAEELIRAGWAYAAAIDNRPLMAHLRLQLASIMLWDGQPRRARDLAGDGLRHLAAGPTGVNLYLKYAQAAARTGDADGARGALARPVTPATSRAPTTSPRSAANSASPPQPSTTSPARHWS
jgi:hypothetical protein